MGDSRADDPGSLIDVVSWFDGQDWWAVLGLEGRTFETTPIRSFRVAGESVLLCDESLLTMTVRILNEGNLVEVVTPSGFVYFFF